jgi:hypothetical protein
LSIQTSFESDGSEYVKFKAVFARDNLVDKRHLEWTSLWISMFPQDDPTPLSGLGGFQRFAGGISGHPNSEAAAIAAVFLLGYSRRSIAARPKSD